MTKTRQQQCDHRPGSSSAIKKTRQQTVRSPLDNRSNAGWELGCDQKDQTTPSVGEEEMDGREDRQQGDDVGR